MVEETTTALALPDEQAFRRDIQAINQFQKIVRANMIDGQDFGVIPGTQKPTLLKPGAEKIAKLLGLADQYEIMDRQEDWGKPFFRYLIKCSLTSIKHGVLISEGLGECNSMESKYRYRWVWASDLPDDFDKDKAIKRWVTLKSGSKSPQYRVDNDDIYSQVNTILKMSKKRALVDAALSAGRLSQVFTQDIEDLNITPPSGGDTDETPSQEEHLCPIHNVPFFKKGRMKGYAHRVEGTDQWCNEEQVKKQVPAQEPIETEPKEQPPTEQADDDLANLPINNLGDLFNACHHHFNLNRSEVFKKLGINDATEIADVKEAWLKVLKESEID